MRGAGYYSANTVGAKHVINKAGDLVIEALSEIAIEKGQGALSIADFGAADGGTSMELMQRLVDIIRQRAPQRQISLGYTDLPHNDFSALFRLTQGLLGEPTDKPLASNPDLFIYGCGTTFYKQLFADNTLDLGFSATAMHWLSRKPGPIADHVQAVGATAEERKAFITQGATDWETILLHRAKELKPGGKLVFANFCADEQGRYLGNTGGVNMFDRFAAHWRALWQAGRITESGISRGHLPAILSHEGRVLRALAGQIFSCEQSGSGAGQGLHHGHSLPLCRSLPP